MIRSWTTLMLTLLLVAGPGHAQDPLADPAMDPFAGLESVHGERTTTAAGTPGGASPSAPTGTVTAPTSTAPVQQGLSDDAWTRMQRQEWTDFFNYANHQKPLRKRLRQLPYEIFLVDTFFDPYWDTPNSSITRESKNAPGAAVTTLMFRDAAIFRPRGMPTFFNVNSFVDRGERKWAGSAGAGTAPGRTAAGTTGATFDPGFDDMDPSSRYLVRGHWGLRDFSDKQKSMVKKMTKDASQGGSSLASLVDQVSDGWGSYQNIRNYMIQYRQPALVLLPNGQPVLIHKLIERPDGLSAMHFWRPTDRISDTAGDEAITANVIYARLAPGTHNLTYEGAGAGGIVKPITNLGPVYQKLGSEMKTWWISGGFRLASVPAISSWWKFFRGGELQLDPNVATAVRVIFWGKQGPFAGGPLAPGNTGDLRPPVTDLPPGPDGKPITDLPPQLPDPGKLPPDLGPIAQLPPDKMPGDLYPPLQFPPDQGKPPIDLMPMPLPPMEQLPPKPEVPYNPPYVPPFEQPWGPPPKPQEPPIFFPPEQPPFIPPQQPPLYIPPPQQQPPYNPPPYIPPVQPPPYQPPYNPPPFNPPPYNPPPFQPPPYQPPPYIPPGEPPPFQPPPYQPPPYIPPVEPPPFNPPVKPPEPPWLPPPPVEPPPIKPPESPWLPPPPLEPPPIKPGESPWLPPPPVEPPPIKPGESPWLPPPPLEPPPIKPGESPWLPPPVKPGESPWLPPPVKPGDPLEPPPKGEIPGLPIPGKGEQPGLPGPIGENPGPLPGIPPKGEGPPIPPKGDGLIIPDKGGPLIPPKPGETVPGGGFPPIPGKGPGKGPGSIPPWPYPGPTPTPTPVPWPGQNPGQNPGQVPPGLPGFPPIPGKGGGSGSLPGDLGGLPGQVPPGPLPVVRQDPRLDFRYAGPRGKRFSSKRSDTGTGLFRLIGYPYNLYGYNRYGFDADGLRAILPSLGFDPWGYDLYGFDGDGYDPWGFDRRGYDLQSGSVAEFPRLLRLRELYIEDPLGFRLKYDIGSTGDVKEARTGLAVWPTDGESHPYSSRKAASNGASAELIAALDTPGATIPAWALVAGSTGLSAGSNPSSTTMTQAGTGSGSPRTNMGLSTIKGRVLGLTAGYTILKNGYGVIYVQPTGDAAIPLSPNISPDDDFVMAKLGSTWTFRQQRPVSK